MWLPLGTYTLDKAWLFTPAVSGTWFRVTHSQPHLNRHGLIAQASAYAPVELHGIKRLWAKREVDLYQFAQPDCWSERVLALRGVPYAVEDAIAWQVTIDVWQSAEDTAKSFQELAETVAKIAKLIELLL